ncbi:MAG: hypothetical protein IT580_11685 [Verrucomicrobiales bacterium]|nr:hypothetical protein [Verrucomicrobiales bacterium]
MKPETCWYALIGGLAGGLGGALVFWSRNYEAPGSMTFWRRGLSLILGTALIASALFAYERAFGPDAVVQRPLVTILVTAWFAIVGAVGLLPLPKRVLQILPGEPTFLLSRWSGVPAFGFLLKRTPLRHLGGRVFLAAAGGNPRLVQETLLAAERIHLGALLGSVPWLVRWMLHGRWQVAGASLLVHVVLNIFPMLHLCQRAVKTGQWWAVQNQPRVR